LTRKTQLGYVNQINSYCSLHDFSNQSCYKLFHGLLCLAFTAESVLVYFHHLLCLNGLSSYVMFVYFVLILFLFISYYSDRLCCLVVRVGYRSRDPGSIPGATRFFLQVVDLERSPLSLMSTTEELLERNRDYGHRDPPR
jgi:hypothetical protein